MDGALQRYVPAILRRCVLSLYYQSLMAGHPGERRMNNSMRREFYMSHVANDVYATVCDCLLCSRNHRTTKRQHKTLFVHTNRVITVCSYRRPRALTEDKNRQPIHLGNDAQALEARESYPDNENKSKHS